MSFISSNISRVFKFKILLLLAFNCFIFSGFSQQTNIISGTLVQEFYAINQYQLFWLSSHKNSKKASEWLNEIDKADKLGLISDKSKTDKIRTELYSAKLIDSTFKMQLDTQITNLVLNFLKDLQMGNINFKYDAISVQRDSVYIFQLLNSKPRESVSKIISRLDCKSHDYTILKKFLQDSISKTDTLRYNAVILAMNYQRFLTLNHQSEYILVNIPSAEAEYYLDDKLQLKMRAVVGRTKNQTPIIASNITSIITFPYWNVPHSIAVKEILPKAQMDSNYLEENNLSVIDGYGNLIADSILTWEKYTEQNFPYYFRQSTGTENALGVLKFNLQNPYSIYLHATNWQGVFEKNDRFLSHGCIRLEKPFELADYLLRRKLDFEKFRKDEENIPSKTWMLPHKIPTYLIYSPAVVVGEKVVFLPDYYKSL
jgi:murein L,D-transpeptidase YcbB/YkuD